MAKQPKKIVPETKWAGGNSIGTKVPEGWYTISEAAGKIGRHRDTLKDWRKDEWLIPSGVMKAGKLDVYLYNDADIETGKALARGEVA